MSSDANNPAGAAAGARLYSLLSEQGALVGELSVPFLQLSPEARANWNRIASEFLAQSNPQMPVSRHESLIASAVPALCDEGYVAGRTLRGDWTERVRDLLVGDDATFLAQGVLYHLASLKRLVGIGQPWQAFDYANRCARLFDEHPGFEYYRALALSRAGNTRMAQKIISEILEYDVVSEPEYGVYRRDALALAGKLAKQRLLKAGRELNPEDLEQAIQGYSAAWEYDRDAFPGINLATMLYLSGREAHGQNVARELCEDPKLAREIEDQLNYWAPATLGEAWLLRGEFEMAEQFYRLAVERAADHSADVASMRDNLELINRRYPVPRTVMELLALGPVLVFAGHRIDPPDTPPALRRFPPDRALEKRVADEIGEALERIAPVAVYCGGASGGDLLLAEQAQERGIEVNLVLPFAAESFCAISVDYGDPRLAHWRQRFDQVAVGAVLHQESDEQYTGDDRLFVFGTEYLQGLTVLRARSLRVQPTALVLLDETSRHGVGGTHWFAEKWREVTGNAVEKIDLAELRDGLEEQS